MNYRYDIDPCFYDNDGYMWSEWLFRYYIALNEKDERTEFDNEKIEMIYNASFKGREALKSVERVLKENIE